MNERHEAVEESRIKRGPVWAQALLAKLPHEPRSIREIAEFLELDVREADTDAFEGALVRARDLPLGAIVVRRSIRETGRKNFTIAHEIGHFVLPGHDRASLACTASDVANWGDSSEAKRFEREADEFAAELLMPASMVERISRGADPCMAVIEEIAHESGSSLSAAAWRYCDLTAWKCAVVWSTDGVIQWVNRSAAFPFFVPRGPVAEGTFAAKCARRERVPTQPRPVPASLWIDSGVIFATPDNPSAGIWEQSKSLPSYRSVISLLWVKDGNIGNQDQRSGR